MKLMVQPGDGIAQLVKAISSAKKSVEIVIFRFDRKEIERALANAVSRGVAVRALIAHTNRAGEENLRALEMRLLAAGVIVARTDDDLIRYHSKLMVIDRRELYVLAFNLTYIDIEHSRTFGIITRNEKLVREAVRLFEADSQRKPYEPGLAAFVVSPLNARKQLSAFIKGAKKELIIYDPQVSDPMMVGLLEDRARAGVEVKIIGHMSRRSQSLQVRKLRQMRLHTRTIIRDGHSAFIGSQSLREAELDARREVGLIFRDGSIVSRMIRTFESDWTNADPSKDQANADSAPAEKVARKVAKAITKDLPPIAPVLDGIVKEVIGESVAMEVSNEEMQEIVKDAVKAAVTEAVMEVVGETESKEEQA